MAFYHIARAIALWVARKEFLVEMKRAAYMWRHAWLCDRREVQTRARLNQATTATPKVKKPSHPPKRYRKCAGAGSTIKHGKRKGGEA